MELGHDFFGLMKTARHAIGQTLLYEPHAKPMEVRSGRVRLQRVRGAHRAHRSHPSTSGLCHHGGARSEEDGGGPAQGVVPRARRRWLRRDSRSTSGRASRPRRRRAARATQSRPLHVVSRWGEIVPFFNSAARGRRLQPERRSGFRIITLGPHRKWRSGRLRSSAALQPNFARRQKDDARLLRYDRDLMNHQCTLMIYAFRLPSESGRPAESSVFFAESAASRAESAARGRESSGRADHETRPLC
jgi:hypothetical protein